MMKSKSFKNRTLLARLIIAGGAACAIGALMSLPMPSFAEAEGAGTIEGSIVDGAGKVMSSGVRVQITCGSTRRTASLDAAGHFSVGGLPEGSCTLVASGSGFQTITLSIAVAGGSIATVLVTMAPPMPVSEPTPAPDAAMPVAMERAPRDEKPMAAPKHAPPRLAEGVGAKPPPPKMVKEEMKVVRLDPANKAAQGRARAQLLAKDDWGGADQDAAAVAPAGWAPVRVFPVPKYTQHYDGPRTDFRETIYWNPSVQTDAGGNATIEMYASDAVTAFRVTAEGFSSGGAPGAGQLAIQSKLPVSLDAHLPVEVTAGDTIKLPVTLENTTDEALDAKLDATFGTAFKLITDPRNGRSIKIPAGGKQTLMFPIQVRSAGTTDVELSLAALGLEDKLKKTIRVVPKGFPFEISASGTASKGTTARHRLDLTGALAGSIQPTVTMYPSPVASMAQGMAGMIREPGGCFEQTSSSNYPNVMILSYLQSSDAADAQLVDQTQGKLDRGYKLLTGYETPEKGYEWFGKTPGHEALTAYGLMEFADMAKVYDVDKSMVERTAAWLMARRDGKGGFSRSSTALDSFGRANETTTTAYIMWALAEADRAAKLDTELAVQKKLGETTKDPYLLALATNTNVLVAPKAADTTAMVKRLIAMQGADGGFTGAKESITMSGGESLTIETTALAVLAMIKASPAGEYSAAIRKSVEYLNGKRGGYGQWGNTQATILGLKALTAYSESARQMQSAGKATLIVNGKPVKTIEFEKGRKDALIWDDFASALTTGKNTIEIQLEAEGDVSLPYSIGVDYRSARPQSSPNAKVEVTTRLVKTQSRMGEGVKLRAHVDNNTNEGLPMTIARIGVPGGMVFQTWQLKELRDKGVIDFYETRPREVILYWRAMAPRAAKDVDIELLSSVPGTYEAPASSAYLYYTAEDKSWTAPVSTTIDR